MFFWRLTFKVIHLDPCSYQKNENINSNDQPEDLQTQQQEDVHTPTETQLAEQSYCRECKKKIKKRDQTYERHLLDTLSQDNMHWRNQMET